MGKLIWGLVIFVVIALVGIIYFKPVASPNNLDIQNKANLIKIEAPMPGDRVTSPLTVRGQARGYWYFEASFPVELKDAAGRVIAQGIAQAQGEWMVETFVPFKVTLEFSEPPTSTGFLILHKDNPSGLPQNDDRLVIPVRF